ncbi:energy-coupling factor transporter transmembrane protein EcfT [Halobacillus litoralis]|uniref:Energy-coupling factor transporter transmembrane protein EcfT n=2 Tax=Halobacillus TaxID=45667 RepID=A0A845FEK1_9BACI|nr:MULTISPECIES: energy-coupling factor transporter transmembrane component T [Halobacillus]MBN9656078.1 energy-coupling factor transporter transmembrane protein EcfT [Halobacillus sp. GSS1]MEC3883897.1 energy-coupling factor transporter transmembrane component T [Halobacillus sp. HZG1]MYL72952.1 energy-coupling factor transporter transmembrane protein EcfT [Halobacillus litoralis]RDY68021.1 energy-coupling factor transporter transmembrane protein EcfT [Halobacillus trueperi]
MSSSLIIGQYIPTDSVIHRLDPRSKIAIIFFFVVIVFFANSVMSYGVLALFAVGSALLSRVPFRYIMKGLKPVWFLIVFTFLLHLIVTREGDVVFSILGWDVYREGLVQGGAISLRFFLLILVTSLLTLTTTPIEITDAIEELLGPLKKVKFPVHELALMMSISLRFIPTLMQETEKISKAQASRGVDFRTGALKDRVKAIVPLLVPLFVSAFKRAEELAMAMEARGYQGGEGRTKLRELRISKLDISLYVLFALLVIALFMTRS